MTLRFLRMRSGSKRDDARITRNPKRLGRKSGVDAEVRGATMELFVIYDILYLYDIYMCIIIA